MEVTRIAAEGLNRRYSVVISASELARATEERLAALQRNLSMQGFRKGKVPAALVRRLHGNAARDEAFGEMVKEAVGAHFREGGDKAAGEPEIALEKASLEDGEDVRLALSYQVMPEIPEVDISDLEVEKPIAQVRDSDVEDELAEMARRTPDYTPREAGEAAKAGDRVLVDLMPFVGGKPVKGKGRNDQSFILAPEARDDVTPALAGCRAGETVRIPVFLSGGAPRRSGERNAVLVCRVKEVSAPRPRAIDEALAQAFSMDSLAALREAVRERLSGRCRRCAHELFKANLFGRLGEKLTFDVPDHLLARAAHKLFHVQSHDESEEAEPSRDRRKLTAQQIDHARAHARCSLFIEEMIQKHGITPDERELDAEIEKLESKTEKNGKKILEFFSQNPRARENIRASVIENRVCDYLSTRTKLTEKSYSCKQIFEEYETAFSSRRERPLQEKLSSRKDV